MGGFGEERDWQCQVHKIDWWMFVFGKSSDFDVFWLVCFLCLCIHRRVCALMEHHAEDLVPPLVPHGSGFNLLVHVLLLAGSHKVCLSEKYSKLSKFYSNHSSIQGHSKSGVDRIRAWSVCVLWVFTIIRECDAGPLLCVCTIFAGCHADDDDVVLTAQQVAWGWRRFWCR